METTAERLEGNLVRLTVTVPAVDVDAAIEKAYRDVAGKLRIPGFRKGKAPRPIIDSHVGAEAVLADAQEALVDATYPQAIDAEDLRPIESPDMGELESLVAGQPFAYAAEVEVRPELGLTSIDDLRVVAGSKTATEAEIDAQIEQTRDRFATVEPAERPVAADDFVLLSFVGTVDGEAYEGNTVDKYLFELGRGLMPEEFDAALIGASAGDEVVAEFEIPDTSSNEEFVGKHARFDITVHEVKAKVMPDLDDEFAANVGGFDTLAEMRDDIRKKLDESKALAYTRRVELLARQRLSSRLDGDIPESIIRQRTESMTREFFETLEESNMTLDGYVAATGVEVPQIQADIAEQARERIAEELALEALFRTLGMEVTQADLDEALFEIAGGDPEALERTRENLREVGATPIVKESIMHRRALEWLLANVEVLEQEPEAPEEKKTKKAAPKRKGAKAGKAEKAEKAEKE
ncbi:MAG: trigger factor [Actinomycetia bacterium]|nr:trigger factor [Actinomycetes bacterium]